MQSTATATATATATSWVLTPSNPTPTPFTHPKSQHPWDTLAHTGTQTPPYKETIVLHRTTDTDTDTHHVLTLSFAEAPDTTDHAFAPFGAAKIIYGTAVLSTQTQGTDTFLDTPTHALKIAADALNAREAKENQAKMQLLALLAAHSH